jgi:hypothetical protein
VATYGTTILATDKVAGDIVAAIGRSLQAGYCYRSILKGKVILPCK